MNAPTKPGENLVLIGLGSNINPEKNLKEALSLLAGLVQVIGSGSIWQTPAYGSQGPDYLNAAVLAKTHLSLEKVKLEVLSKIEQALGRVRQEDKYADRTIDLDVLVINSQVLDDELWAQPHVLIPAADVLPDLENPLTGETIAQAAAKMLPGTRLVERIDLA